MFHIAGVLVGLLAASPLSAQQPAEPKEKETSIFVMNDDGTNARKLASVPGFSIINSPELSPDGKWVAVDGWREGENLRDARLLFVNVESGETTDLGEGAMPTWSSDGRWIAFCRYPPRQGVYIRSLETGLERLLDRDGWGIQWSPEGLHAAYTRGGNLVIYDFIGDTKREFAPDTERLYTLIYWNCKWSPDSKRICFKGRLPDGTEELAIVTVAGEPELRVRCRAEEYNPDIAWHPDGSRIAIPRKGAPGRRGQIHVLDPAANEPPAPLPGQPLDRDNAGMCWSRDGKLLVFVSRE